MNILVPDKLREIEKQYNVTVLYAAESGSRAWGFASPDSDFDIRFIYKRRQSDYLRLDKTRDVIDFPVDDVWDISGWDLDKTLKLLFASNPGLYDWMGSPICYYDTGFKTRIDPLLESYFSAKRMICHHHGIAKKRIAEKEKRITPKKYFYALRSILVCKWVIEKDCAPPVLFSELMDEVLPYQLKSYAKYIMDKKANAPEKSEIDHVREIDVFLDAEYNAIEKYIRQLPKETEKSWEKQNSFFLTETGI